MTIEEAHEHHEQLKAGAVRQRDVDKQHLSSFDFAFLKQACHGLAIVKGEPWCPFSYAFSEYRSKKYCEACQTLDKADVGDPSYFITF